LFVNEPPQSLTAETQMDNFNSNLSSASPAKFTGTYISATSPDQNGTPRANPPSMGALEFQTNPSTSSYFGGSGVIGGSATF
jgi:hypothetical protein